jgi:hypothetical protein
VLQRLHQIGGAEVRRQGSGVQLQGIARRLGAGLGKGLNGLLNYLGSNTERYQSQWPVAAVIGAVLGAIGALVILRAWRTRRGILLFGLVFSVLQAVVVSVVWPGGK